ncbi:ankyrin repeat domain-containing protein [Endozoicomonas sp. ONNA2]|uniref:ankyrin repeat domain-containing protein n=1 Tax=Endozoicomonas sp. ONNA2 TaxID=2828741 RepID=UPI0021473445|nr:ankyrin repeat domain-containing protein [Endozoicomonas sp. ONNA2]
MNPTGGAIRQTPICIICTKKDSSPFGGRSFVKSSCSQGHQFHLDCIYQSLSRQDNIRLDRRLCDACPGPAMPLLRNRQNLAVDACQKNDCEALEKMLQLNPNIHRETDNGSNLLTIATQNNSTECIEALIKAGADVNVELLKCLDLFTVPSAGIGILYELEKDINNLESEISGTNKQLIQVKKSNPKEEELKSKIKGQIAIELQKTKHDQRNFNSEKFKDIEKIIEEWLDKQPRYFMQKHKALCLAAKAITIVAGAAATGAAVAMGGVGVPAIIGAATCAALNLIDGSTVGLYAGADRLERQNPEKNRTEDLIAFEESYSNRTQKLTPFFANNEPLKNEIISSYKEGFCLKYREKIYGFIEKKLNELFDIVLECNIQNYITIEDINLKHFNKPLPDIPVEFLRECIESCHSGIIKDIDETLSEIIEKNILIQTDRFQIFLTKESFLTPVF